MVKNDSAEIILTLEFRIITHIVELQCVPVHFE